MTYRGNGIQSASCSVGVEEEGGLEEEKLAAGEGEGAGSGVGTGPGRAGVALSSLVMRRRACGCGAMCYLSEPKARRSLTTYAQSRHLGGDFVMGDEEFGAAGKVR